MQREYHRWRSNALQRDMEFLVFGHGGTPVIVFPTSVGRFFDYEDRGMVGAIADIIDRGAVQLYCVDSVDGESWYNYGAPPRARVERHLQYDRFILSETIPFIRSRNSSGSLFVTGCSFGGYHAVNFSLRHPDMVDRCISLSGAFDIKQFLDGYYDEDCYFHSPTDYLPRIGDPWYLERYCRNFYLLVTGEHDMCWDKNEQFAAILRAKGIPHALYVWGDNTGHDWPWWQHMAQAYLP